MFSLATKYPLAGAVVLTIVQLLLTLIVIDVAGDVRPNGWMSALPLVGVAYAFGSSWFVRHRASFDRLPDRKAQLLLSLALSPALIGWASVFLGAAPWSVWVAAIASALLMGWWVVTTRSETAVATKQ